MKQNINEELNYMKYLFGYKKGVVISEQETTPEAPATPATPTQQGGDGCQEFTSVGRFAEKSADGGQQEIQTLINDIISKPEFKNGATITSMKIIGGASNVEKGEQTSWDLDNNYNENPDTKINRGPKYNANVGYATKRANTAQEPVIKGLAASGINLGAGVTPVIEAKVIYTYGTSDSSNATKIKSGEVKPGQVVIVKLVVCPVTSNTGREEIDKLPYLKPTLIPTTPKDIPIQLAPLWECFNGIEIDINYDRASTDQTHNCSAAVWDMSANDVELYRNSRNGTKVNYASLNNKVNQQNPNFDKYDDATKQGKYRFNKFTIDEITAKEFINLDSLQKYQGELQIFMKCQAGKSGAYGLPGHQSSGGGCHDGTASIVIKTKEGATEEQIQPPVQSGEKDAVYTIPACSGIYKRLVSQGVFDSNGGLNKTVDNTGQTGDFSQMMNYLKMPQDVRSNIQKVGQALQK
jgi:hypothetical protein